MRWLLPIALVNNIKLMDLQGLKIVEAGKKGSGEKMADFGGCA